MNELLKKEKILSGRVDRAIAKVRAVVDLVFEKSATRSLNTTQSNLAIDETNNNFVLAVSDLDDSPPAAHLFSALGALQPTPSPQKGLVSKKVIKFQWFPRGSRPTTTKNVQYSNVQIEW